MGDNDTEFWNPSFDYKLKLNTQMRLFSYNLENITYGSNEYSSTEDYIRCICQNGEMYPIIAKRVKNNIYEPKYENGCLNGDYSKNLIMNKYRGYKRIHCGKTEADIRLYVFQSHHIIAQAGSNF